MRKLVIAAAFAMLSAVQAAAEGTVPAHVGSAACTACHEAESAAWSGSHHALAWTLPGPETVVADFDGTSFEGAGMSVLFRQDAAGYHASVTESDGSTRDYTVHSVAGIEPLQQYLFETEPGRLQSFDIVWDTVAGRWFHLYGDNVIPPDDGLHWTGPYKTWNARCAECHATQFEKNYDAELRTYASTQAEIGVGCESCHGPGAAHLDWAGGRAVSGYDVALDRYGFTQSFATTEATIQQCATCHSRREAHDDASPLPGTPYDDSYNLSLLRPGLYHADGQSLDEVFVYGSFLQSRMYAKGVGCLDCHDAHRADLVAEGNAVCTQCHNPAGNPEFPTLRPAEYDSPAHHFHEQGTAGAECKNCHMVERVYMGNDWRADHSFRVPRPDLSAVTGAPDACTVCHSDQDAAWAAGKLVDWYPDSDHRGPHYGVTLALGAQDPVAVSGDLAGLATDAGQPAIVRATALWLLEAANSPETATQLEPLLSDDEPLVRAAAAGLQRVAAPQDRVLPLIGLLDDPLRNVRISGARALLGAPILRLPPAMQAQLDESMAEWRRALASRLDFPETHLQLAGIALTLRAFSQAAGAFRETVTLDPQQEEAWVMLMRLAEATEGPAAAQGVLREARAALPESRALAAAARELGLE
jgi:hypothetical protein